MTEEVQAEPKTYEPPNPSIKECIQLNQLMPIIDIDKNIDAISSVIYENDDLLNEFLQKVDNRTKICKDDPKGEFIMCEQNRDGDSYRSPYSNTYYPPTEDAKYPTAPLRDLEEKLNKMFKLYIKHYYSLTTLCSVYCWELGDTLADGYGVAVLIKNSLTHQKKVNSGSWDSSNLITVTFENEGGKKKAKYNLITTVNLAMSFEGKMPIPLLFVPMTNKSFESYTNIINSVKLLLENLNIKINFDKIIHTAGIEPPTSRSSVLHSAS